jgi:hypothetical protein
MITAITIITIIIIMHAFKYMPCVENLSFSCPHGEDEIAKPKLAMKEVLNAHRIERRKCQLDEERAPPEGKMG